MVTAPILFFRDRWDRFDVLVIAAWLVDTFAGHVVELPIDPMILRVHI